MKEIPLLFGPEDAPLMGTVTTPESDTPGPVACLMLNMGAGYRIGPRRINVKLARHLAAQGISSLRMDLSGLGDSSAPTGGEGFTQQAVRDLQAAMRQMELMFGTKRFIVIGLCSGGARGLSLAVADPRVIGLLMFDSFAFPTRRTLLMRDIHRAVALARNPAIYGKTWRWLKAKFGGSRAPTVQIFDAEPLSQIRRFFHDAMTQLAAREVALFLLYSGTLHVRDHGRDQLGTLAREPFARQVEYRFIPEIDHGLTELRSQAIFMDVVGNWVMRTVQGRTPARAAGSAMAAAAGAQLPATNDSVFAYLASSAPSGRG